MSDTTTGYDHSARVDLSCDWQVQLDRELVDIFVLAVSLTAEAGGDRLWL